MYALYELLTLMRDRTDTLMFDMSAMRRVEVSAKRLLPIVAVTSGVVGLSYFCFVIGATAAVAAMVLLLAVFLAGSRSCLSNGVALPGLFIRSADLGYHDR